MRVEGVGKSSIQGDVRFAEALASMGANITMGDNWIESSGSGKLKAIDLDCNHIPDAAMTLAVAALFADGTTTLRNIASWRVKETDRIAAMATELRKVGATVEEGPDYIRVTPPAALTPNAVIDTYDDHRMAMCFGLVALGGVPVRINDPKCVAKTFPDYFECSAMASQLTMNEHLTHPRHRHRRPLRFRQRHGRRTGGQGTRLPLPRQRCDLPRHRPGGAVRAASPWMTKPLWPNLPASWTSVSTMAKSGWTEKKSATRCAPRNPATPPPKSPLCPRLRAALLAFQRSFRKAPGLVADGRDMGSVVFPDATLKIFLTASAEVRAERRYKQLMEKGMHANLSQILQDLQQRDARDSARSVAPLQKCADASLLDTSTLTIAEAVNEVLSALSGKHPPGVLN